MTDSLLRRMDGAGTEEVHFRFGDGEPRSLLSLRRQREDFRSAVAFVRSLDWVDANRIALWGYSLGGGNVQAIAMGRSQIAAAICVAPVVELAATFAHMSGHGHFDPLLGSHDEYAAART